MKIPQLIAFFIHFESTTIYFTKQGKFPVLHISGNSTENVLAKKTICWRFREKKPEKKPRSNYKYCFRFACQHLNLETSSDQADFN